MKADVECTTPVEAIFDDTTCALHIDIPPIRSYNQIRVSLNIIHLKYFITYIVLIKIKNQINFI